MDGGFPYGDIIVIGAIAAFLILRYRAMLGEKSGRDVEPMPRNSRNLSELEPVIQLPEREAARKKGIDRLDLAHEPERLSEQFAAMRAIDPEFTASEFIGGAKAAFEMVLTAYNEADHETLRMLLAEPIYQQFKRSLDENDKAGRKAHSTLVAIVKADIADATLHGSKARITVDFVSEQIPLVRNAEGEIVEGNASQQEAIEDQWVFARDLKQSDPAWKVVET